MSDAPKTSVSELASLRDIRKRSHALRSFFDLNDEKRCPSSTNIVGRVEDGIMGKSREKGKRGPRARDRSKDFAGVFSSSLQLTSPRVTLAVKWTELQRTSGGEVVEHDFFFVHVHDWLGYKATSSAVAHAQQSDQTRSKGDL